MKPAFSTVACPDWTLDHLASKAQDWGYLGVELRTFGHASRQFACDPALTSYAKTRALLDHVALEPMCLATGIRYDAPVSPPILGHVFGDHEASVRETKSALDLASHLECPFVRVFAFEIIREEKRSNAVTRICDRLAKALDAARNTGVRLLIENGGSFNTAADLAEILDRCASPLLGAAYNVAVGFAAGERPRNAFNVLGESLLSVKVSDHNDGMPRTLGAGDVPAREAVEALASMNYDGWIVYEYPRAWLSPEHDPLADPSEVLASAARMLYSWMGQNRVIARPRAGALS